jgi:hypothetical protein
VPARTYLWDDLDHPAFPRCHRLFLLPNCYLADAAASARWRDRLCRDGNVLVCGPGTGITDGTTVAPEYAAALLGLPFELYDYDYPRTVTLDAWDHPLTAGLGACESYGDTLRYGPVLVPWDQTAPPCAGGVKPRQAAAPVGDGRFTRLGSIYLDNGKRQPGLVVKEFGRGAAGNGRPGPRGPGDYAIVFTAALPLPAWLLRRLARFSGTHVYNDEDDVVFADGGMVAVHAVKPGPRVLHLPAPARVTDAITGVRLGGLLAELPLTIAAPTTRWFWLDPA